jgi:hypothetical protein
MGLVVHFIVAQSEVEAKVAAKNSRSSHAIGQLA